MEFNAYSTKIANGGRRHITVLGNEGGDVRFAADRRDARNWEKTHKSFWSRPATRMERVILLIDEDSAEQHRASFWQWCAHRLWERKADFIAALRLVGAYCANWPLQGPLTPDQLVEKIGEIRPWEWSRPAGFGGSYNLASALELVNNEISRYEAMDDEQALDEEYKLLRDDEEWCGLYNGHLILCGKELESAERGMWESRLRCRLLRAVRAVRAA